VPTFPEDDLTARRTERVCGTGDVLKRWARAPLLLETLSQVGKNAPNERSLQGRATNDALPVDLGKVGEHFTSVGIAEHKPRVAFIGDPAFGLDGLPKQACRVTKKRQFLPRPISPMDAPISQMCCTHLQVSPEIPHKDQVRPTLTSPRIAIGAMASVFLVDLIVTPSL
jgi:hypothetical protein